MLETRINPHLATAMSFLPSSPAQFKHQLWSLKAFQWEFLSRETQSCLG